MKLKNMSILDIVNTYNEHMVRDFDSEELKPIDKIKSLFKEDKYIGLGLYEGDDLYGYAFFASDDDKKMLLLDYLAVVSEHRSKGLGSDFIGQIKEFLTDYTGILAEVEDPRKFANEDDKLMKEKRVNFYLKNGLRKTSFYSDQFNHKYNIMYFPLEKDMGDETLFEKLREIHRSVFPFDILGSKVTVYYD